MELLVLCHAISQMPFNKKAKIEIVNENELPFILYFQY